MVKKFRETNLVKYKFMQLDGRPAEEVRLPGNIQNELRSDKYNGNKSIWTKR